jgi:hypothetical protein
MNLRRQRAAALKTCRISLALSFVQAQAVFAESIQGMVKGARGIYIDIEFRGVIRTLEGRGC